MVNIEIPIAYPEQQVERPAVLTNLDRPPEDIGLMGARLGLADNAQTGSFMGHQYSVSEIVVPIGDDWLKAARSTLADHCILVVNAPADRLMALPDLPEAEGALIFNASAETEALREVECRANLLQTMPSYAMRSDALMQFLVSRRWTDRTMINGQRDADREFAKALRVSATGFGARLTQTDVIGKVRAPREERAKLLDEQAQMVRATLTDWVNGPPHRSPLRLEIRQDDGAILDLFAQAMPDRGFVISFNDLGKERRAIEEMHRLNETLEARVRVRTLELESARDEAERANASKSRFVA